MKSKNKARITLRTVSSDGLSFRIKNHKTGRDHLLLSLYEACYFLILEFADNVMDIEAQHILDLKETQLIAEALGVKHPYAGKKRTDQPMSTDFLIQLEDRTIARTFKPIENLNNRVIEKFEIERIYWERRDVEWSIVTQEQLPENLVHNLDRFREYYKATDTSDQLILSVLSEWMYLWDEHLTFAELVGKVSKGLSIPFGQCFAIIMHLLSRKKLHFNHIYKFSDDLPLKLGYYYARKNHQ